MSSMSTLHELLFVYANENNAEDRSRIEAEVWQKFGMQGAVFILDMAGFSYTTQRHGIVYYLSMVRRMQVIVAPIIERYSGKVVKFEADNCFAWFPDVESAIDAAIGIYLATEATNRTTPEDLDIELSCGIDYGDFLLLEEGDYFGDPVNRACKLGEDLGRPGEILITQDAVKRVGESTKFRFENVQYAISSISLEACRVLY